MSAITENDVKQAALRDALPPKLAAGQIRLRNAERFAKVAQ